MRTCKKCGCSEYNNQGKCSNCVKKRDALYYLKNKNKIKVRGAKYYAENKEKINKIKSSAKYKESRKKYREKNKEILAEKLKKWRLDNKEKIRIANIKWREKNPNHYREYKEKNPNSSRICKQNRRARIREDGGKLSKGLAEKLYKLQKGKCVCCGMPLGDDYHLDHIIPIVKGGKNVDANIQLLRNVCNKQKAGKHPIDFMQERGFLL